MSQQDFEKLLQELNKGENIFKEKIHPQIEKIAVETLESVKENIQSRRNTF